MTPHPTRLRLLKITFRIVANVGVVDFLMRLFPTFFLLQGGLKGAVFLGLLFTVLNTLVMPLLRLLTLPVRLFTGLLGTILMNAAFLWIAVQLTDILAIEGFSLSIGGGMIGWILLSLALGACNAVVRMVGG